MSTTNELRYFTILGERCSGTTFVRYAIEWNLGLEYYDVCGKHFFGHDKSVFQTDKMKQTLVVCVVRGAVEWIDSYFKRLHHVTPQNKRSIYNFLNNEFYTIKELAPHKGEEWMEDRHLITKERYRNIFEMRKTKADFLMRELPQLVSNVLILRYEDMRENYAATLDRVRDQFGLKRLNDPYTTITQYKGTYTACYFKKPILIGPREQEHILKSVDREQETALGYDFPA
jgi:hypothetical protein